MVKTIGILQPGYLPWLGFFEQIYKSDVFILYDDVQYDKEGWRNRNRIKTAQGWQWLTVPVHIDFNSHPPVADVKIDNKSYWLKKHLAAIRQNYGAAPYYRQYSTIFTDALTQEWEYLVDLDLYFIVKIMELLGIDTAKLVRSSTLGVKGDRLGRLAALCRLFDADIFYEGASGRNYIDEQFFAGQGITVVYQDYRHPVYTQLHGPFIPYLSVIDLLFNHGRDSLAILLNSRAGEKAKQGEAVKL